MSDLAQVLELMHTRWQRWTTLRLEGHEWRHLETFGRAWQHHVEELHKGGAASARSIAFKRSDGRQPAAESREDWRVWLAKPDKSRTEFKSAMPRLPQCSSVGIGGAGRLVVAS